MKHWIAAVLALALCMGAAFSAQAKITGVGKPDKKSYVKASDPRQVIIYAGDSRVMFCTAGTKVSDARTNIAFCFVNGGNVNVIKPSNGKLTSRFKGYIDKYRSRNPVIVFAFGLNGNSNPEKNAKRIIKIYNKWMAAYPDLKFYVESIGPTKLGSGPYGNPNVIRLNQALKEEFEPRGIWLDTYTYLSENDIVNSSGKGLRDNYHYKWKTCKKQIIKIRELVEADLAKEAEDQKKQEETEAGDKKTDS